MRSGWALANGCCAPSGGALVVGRGFRRRGRVAERLLEFLWGGHVVRRLPVMGAVGDGCEFAAEFFPVGRQDEFSEGVEVGVGRIGDVRVVRGHVEDT